MAPEQARGEPADERSDIYSLGCLLYALLTGRPPFTGELAAVVHQHVHLDPRPLREENGRVSQTLEALVMAMLAKSPQERPQSAALVRDRLQAALASSPTTATARITETARPPKSARSRLLGGARPRIERRRLLAGAALAGVLLIAAIIALSSLGGSKKSASSPPRTAHAATKRPSRTTPTATAARPSAAATTSASAPPAGPTVSTAATALSSLVAQDLASGQIDQHAARQITDGLSSILGAYGTGRVIDAQRGLADLSRKLAKLEGHERVGSAAAPALTSALAGLGEALGLGLQEASTAPGAQVSEHAKEAPGHGGERPGKAKKHGGD
jgi:serine/threonine-protein kinase